MKFTESFWSFFIVSALGFLGGLLALLYKSKCAEVSICCGFLQVRRNVEVELQEDAMERRQQTHPTGTDTIGINL